MVYPRIPLQLYCAHKMRRIASKVSRKEGSYVAEASGIYRAGSQAEACGEPSARCEDALAHVQLLQLGLWNRMLSTFVP